MGPGIAAEAGAVIAFPPAGTTLPGSPMAHNEYPGDVDSPDAGIRVSRRIADELRHTRVARSLSIEDVAAILRIRPDFIRAMEEDRFDDLPGPAYISGFLRTYATHLGLDGERLVAWFKDDSQSTFAPREMGLPVPITEIRRPTFPIITVSLVVAVGIAVAWYVFQESRTIDIDLIPEVPGPVAEETSTGLSDGEPDSGTMQAARDDAAPTVDDPDDAAPLEAAGLVADGAGDGDPGDTAAQADVSLDETAGPGVDQDDTAAQVGDPPEETADQSDAAAQVVVPAETAGLAADGAGDGDSGDAATQADVSLEETAGPGVDHDDAAAQVGDPPEETVDPGDVAAQVVVPAETAGLAADGAGDGDSGDAATQADVSLEETAGPGVDHDDAAAQVGDPPEETVDQSDAAAQADVLAETAGLETGDGEAWDEPVFAAGDTVQDSVAGESHSQHAVYGTPGAGSRIELRAIGETWVQVTASDGVVVLTHILLPGDVYHVPSRDDLMLDTGNAGGLEIRVDGVLMPPLGGAGAVVRDIALSVDSLTGR